MVPSNIPTHYSKNEEMAYRNIGGHQENMEIICVINVIEETLKTVKGFLEQSKIQLYSNLSQ